MPGNIGFRLNTTSLQNVLDVALPIAAYEALADKTIEINWTDAESFIYNFTIRSLHFNSVDIANTVFEEIKDENKVHIKMTGITFDASPIDASFNILKFINVSPVSITMKNAEIDVVMESSTVDNVHYTLAEKTKVNVGLVNITFSNPLLNELVEHLNASTILNDCEPLIAHAVDNAVADLNKMVQQ